MQRTTGHKAALGAASLTTALMSATMLTPLAARAADADATASSASRVAELVVTAEKREENIQTVPVAVQAIGQKQLTQMNVTEFQDYIKLMPSVSFQTTGPNQTSIYMRGVSSGDNANHSGPLPSVGSYLDEQPITTIGGTLDVHIYDIARIEVLPGPQGTLYGASSEAGTLRIITNKPSPSGFSAAYDLAATDWKGGGLGYVAEGYANIPINDKTALRVVGWDEHDPGFIQNVPGTRTFFTSGVTINNNAFLSKHANPADTVGGRAALGIDLNENWTITPSVIGQAQHNTGTFGYEPMVGFDKYQRFGPDSDTDNWVQAALTAQGKIGRYDLVYSGGYFWREVEQRTDYTDYSIQYDAYFGSGFFWQDSHGNPLNTPQQVIFGHDRFGKESNEARISSPATDQFRFIAGVFQERQTHWIIQDYQIPGFGPQLAVPGWPNTIWLTDQNRVDRDEAVFGEVSYDITKDLTFTGGVRGYHYKNSLFGFFGFSEGYDALTGFSSGMGDTGQFCQAGKKWEDAPCVDIDKVASGEGETHKLNLTWRPTSDALLYITYSTGYRPGGNNRNVNFGQYQPDYLTNYEFGWKTSWFDHRLVLDGAAFYEQWDKFQFSFLGQNSLTIIENAPSATVTGVEANVAARPDEHFTVTGALAYTDAELAKNFCGADPATGLIIPSCSDPNAVALHGTQLPYTPRFKGNATVRYAWDMGDWKAHVQGAVAYQTSVPVGLRTADIMSLGGMGGYTTVDFSAGVTKDKYRIEFFVKNAFDSHGQINRFTPCTVSVCTAIKPDGPGALYVIPVSPQTFGIRIGEDF